MYKFRRFASLYKSSSNDEGKLILYVCTEREMETTERKKETKGDKRMNDQTNKRTSKRAMNERTNERTNEGWMERRVFQMASSPYVTNTNVRANMTLSWSFSHGSVQVHSIYSFSEGERAKSKAQHTAPQSRAELNRTERSNAWYGMAWHGIEFRWEKHSNKAFAELPATVARPFTIRILLMSKNK